MTVLLTEAAEWVSVAIACLAIGFMLGDMYRLRRDRNDETCRTRWLHGMEPANCLLCGDWHWVDEAGYCLRCQPPGTRGSKVAGGAEQDVVIPSLEREVECLPRREITEEEIGEIARVVMNQHCRINTTWPLHENWAIMKFRRIMVEKEA